MKYDGKIDPDDGPVAKEHLEDYNLWTNWHKIKRNEKGEPISFDLADMGAYISNGLLDNARVNDDFFTD